MGAGVGVGLVRGVGVAPEYRRKRGTSLAVSSIFAGNYGTAHYLQALNCWAQTLACIQLSV